MRLARAIIVVPTQGLVPSLEYPHDQPQARHILRGNIFTAEKKEFENMRDNTHTLAIHRLEGSKALDHFIRLPWSLYAEELVH